MWKIRASALVLLLNSALPAFFLYLGLSFGVAVGELEGSRVNMACLAIAAVCLLPGLLLSTAYLRFKKAWARWGMAFLLILFSTINLLFFAYLVKSLGFFLLTPAMRSTAWMAWLMLCVPFLPGIAGLFFAWHTLKSKP